LALASLTGGGRSVGPDPHGLLRQGLLLLLYTTLYLYGVLYLSLICMKVRDYDFLAWVQGQREMSQVLGTIGLLDFTCFETYTPFISLIFQFLGGM
jgi:hypothetical protein